MVSNVSSFNDGSSSTEQTKSASSAANEERIAISRDNWETSPASPQTNEAKSGQEFVVTEAVGNQPESNILKSGYNLSSSSDLHEKGSRIADNSQLVQLDSNIGMQLICMIPLVQR